MAVTLPHPRLGSDLTFKFQLLQQQHNNVSWYYLSITYSALGTVQSALRVLRRLTAAPPKQFHCTDEKTEAQSEDLMCLRARQRKMAEPRVAALVFLAPGSVLSKPHYAFFPVALS